MIKINQIIYGNNRKKLKEFPNNFFDGIITDPPYEINFMGKKWDSTGIAYSVELWEEILRVVKPGSFLFCFGGTRTYHRVTCAIEDAGWIIKDQMMWCYGEGFPKSTNISKQIDKEAGVEREVIGRKQFADGTYQRATARAGIYSEQKGQALETAPATDDAKQWDGYGTGLKPGWEPIIVAMKPLEKGLTYAQNAKKWSVAGLNIDGGRIDINSNEDTSRGLSHQQGWKQTSPAGSGSIDNSCQKGRWPANVILSHSPDCVCVGTKQIKNGEYKKRIVKKAKSSWKNASENIEVIAYGKEIVEVWACVPDCPIRIMDDQTKNLSYPTRPPNIESGDKSMFGFGGNVGQKHADIYGKPAHNGASRFFYCAKAKRNEKEADLIGFIECIKCEKFNSKTHTIIVNGKKKKEKCTRNNHPTVKPLSLMKYLCTLLKMPNKDQIILDPFCGTGTTLAALEQLEINYVGIEQDQDSYLIAITKVGDYKK